MRSRRGEQRGGEQEHGTDDGEDAGSVEQAVDLVFEEESDDSDGDHRDDDFEHIGLFVVEPAGEESADQPHDFAPQDDDRTQRRGGVECDVEGEVFFELHAEELLGDLQVSAARYGQELRDTLHDAEQDGLQCVHVSLFGFWVWVSLIGHSAS